LKFVLILGLSTAAAILVGLVLALLCCIKRTRKHKQFAQRNFEALGKLQDLFTSLTDGESNTTTLFSLKELEKATNGFADDQKLGVGGFGTVYKGTMESGLNVAVKRTNQLDTSGAHQFLNEVALLSQVNHRNLVRLHGCCLETEVPMLVYEYVPNGNLSEHLRGEKSSELEHLTWPKRMQIAIETAEALTYLHSEANPPIYHRDVKSSNILLNNTYGVKVSDFGISKLIPLDATHVSTIAQGTPGYWDPEYFLSYQLTDKSDVYSFGVILLELITSQPPVDLNRDKMEMSLVAMCIPQIKEGNFEAIVDPKLLSSNFEEIQTTLQEIEKVATLAMHCLAFKGNDRPSMKQVTEVLHQIKGRNCQWSEGGKNMSSEFGLVGVDEIKSIQELELVQLMDANTPNSSQSSNTLSHSSHSNNSSSPCVRK
jgi:serine/threonine protein kinase